MPMTIRIELKGLALCLLKRGAVDWTVLFPCDKGVHDLWFKYPGVANPVKLHDPEGSDLKIGFNNEVIQADGPEWENTSHIFNPNQTYAHAGELKEQRSMVNKIDEIRMSVPHAKLEGHDEGNQDYFVQRQDYPGAPIVRIDPVSTKLTLTFRVTNKLIMSVTKDGQNVRPPFEVPFQNGRTVVLQFNNDCNVKCTHNDSLDLYALVVDRLMPNLKFASGKITRHDSRARHRDIDIKKSPYGNCDPAWSEPPWA